MLPACASSPEEGGWRWSGRRSRSCRRARDGWRGSRRWRSSAAGGGFPTRSRPSGSPPRSGPPRAALSGAVLHLFGAPPGLEAPGIAVHPPPEDSAEVYAPGSILAVPLRIASGVRIKILEAWARGVPVVATPAALAGLEAEDGREALVARDASEFAQAIARLHQEPGLAAALVEAGRRARRGGAEAGRGGGGG